ncbi:FkbM family methyltransferase [Spirosoma luteum]|uniref:FkbM family methyltransferase n=1 Tax=Spirosoma luteum TaxID=431553 RepID=UPI000379F58F|nr:FkbM family methyltransferase [Spirosoma luteum]
MKKRFVDLAKAGLSSLGLFAARQYPNRVNGYRLTDDLSAIVPGNTPLCFDIGANKGQTIELLQSTFKQPVIHAFEPASATFTALSSRAPDAGVYLHQLAFGEQIGVTEFRNCQQSELSSFLPLNRNKAENIFAEEAVVSIESVRVETLDNFCTTHHIDHIDLLKIDTQGFELPVLRGGASLLGQGKVGAVLLELNFAPLYEGQSDPLEILQLMRSHNMRLVDYYEKERVSGKELSWTTALFVLHA